MSIGRFEERVARLRQMLREQDLDGLLVSQPESRYYLSGYTGHDLPPRDSAGYLLITDDRTLLLTDPRTTEQASREAQDYEIAEVRNGITVALPPLVKDLGIARLGFEGIHLPYHIFAQTIAALGDGVLFRETVGLVDSLRITKDETELAALRAAIALSDKCVDHLLGWLRPGLSEKEVAWEVEVFTRTHGGDDIAFDTIVASGPNAAMPHAVPTDRLIGSGEPVTIDMGTVIGHYRSDITRTVCFGKPPDWLEQVYGIVLEAQERAEALIRAGLTGREADAIAREVIANAGYGEQFRHSLGHGIGLEGHEPPSISMRSDELLKPGMVFSVEPGIYMPGTGGVRIEDLALLGPAGVEVLTHAPKGKQFLRL